MDEIIIDLIPTLHCISLCDLYYVAKNYGWGDPITDWMKYDELSKVEFILGLEKYKGISIDDTLGWYILDNGWQIVLQYIRDNRIDKFIQ